MKWQYVELASRFAVERKELTRETHRCKIRARGHSCLPFGEGGKGIYMMSLRGDTQVILQIKREGKGS